MTQKTALNLPPTAALVEGDPPDATRRALADWEQEGGAAAGPLGTSRVQSPAERSSALRTPIWRWQGHLVVSSSEAALR